MITVRIAHAEPGPGRPTDTGPRVDPRVPAVARLLGFDVVLADDAGHRALRAWLGRDPVGTPLPMLLDRPGDDIWTTQGNMDFGAGLDRWDLDSSARELIEEAAARVEHDYSAAAEGQSAVLSSASAEPRGPAMLAQTIFADDYRGATVAFGAEIRAEDVSGQAGLRLEILRKGWRIEADRRVERTVDVTGSQDWARREITVTVPADTDVIRFGITLAGRGRVWLRNPELRRERPQDAGSAGVG